jgi:hypothetical protein
VTIKAINDPLYEYTCDLCGKQDTAKWMPPLWESLSINLLSGGMGQFQICQECITQSSIVILLNKAKTKHDT